MEIIILLIIISLLVVILFIALKKLIESITTDSKDYYFKKIQDLDGELLKKKEELDNLNQTKKEEIKEEEKRVVENNQLDKKLLDVLNTTDYDTGNALKVANEVDEIFQVDEEKIISDFVSKIEVNDDYQVYQKLQDRFSPNLIYKLKMLNTESQINVISKLVSDEEYEVFKSYIDTRKFKLNKFLQDLDLLIERNRPTIEIIVGNKRKNYEKFSPFIKMTYSDDVYKGFIIKYQDRIYDYSINERDV